MTTGENNGGPLSGQPEGYQGEDAAASVNEIFPATGFFRPHGRLLH